MENEHSIIYMATSRTSCKSYIGQTCNGLNFRKRSHELDAERGSDTHFHRALRKYGFEDFEWEILWGPVSRGEEIDLEEQRYICSFNTYNGGYNSTRGGGGNYGRMMSLDTRSKMAVSRRGKKHSEETKRRIGQKTKAYWAKYRKQRDLEILTKEVYHFHSPNSTV
jgi:group I intron endonuclease